MADTDRQARLTELNQAITTWATKQRERLERDAAFAKKILKARTGAERLTEVTTAAASELVAEEILKWLET